MPTTCLPNGQVAVTNFGLPESVSLVAVTTCRPGNGLAQTALALTDQVPNVPFSSSMPRTETLVGVEGTMRSTTTLPGVLPVTRNPVPTTRFDPGQLTFLDFGLAPLLGLLEATTSTLSPPQIPIELTCQGFG